MSSCTAGVVTEQYHLEEVWDSLQTFGTGQGWSFVENLAPCPIYRLLHPACMDSYTKNAVIFASVTLCSYAFSVTKKVRGAWDGSVVDARVARLQCSRQRVGCLLAPQLLGVLPLGRSARTSLWTQGSTGEKLPN